MRLLFRLVLWNIAFGIALIATVFVLAVWVQYFFPSVGRGAANVVAAGLPALLALWVLFLGSRYATRRGTIIACAVAAGAGVLLQAGLLLLLIAWSQGVGGRTSTTGLLEALLGADLIAGVALVWAFLHSKRSRAHRHR